MVERVPRDVGAGGVLVGPSGDGQFLVGVGPTYQMCVDARSPVATAITSQNSVVQPRTPRCSYAQSSAAPLIGSDLSQVKSSNTEWTL